MTRDEIKNKLKDHLNQHRYLHSVGVMEEARRLAQIHGADVDKAEIAGLLHDCAKNFSGDEAIRLLRFYGTEPDEIQLKTPQLLHGLLGYYIARDQYGVEDEEILNAIYWHTTGKAGMTLLEKIIFVADYTEPGRTFEGLDEIRQAACHNLDQCIALCADSTIRYILKKGHLLHPLTVETRNDALASITETVSG